MQAVTNETKPKFKKGQLVRFIGGDKYEVRYTPYVSYGYIHNNKVSYNYRDKAWIVQVYWFEGFPEHWLEKNNRIGDTIENRLELIEGTNITELLYGQ